MATHDEEMEALGERVGARFVDVFALDERAAYADAVALGAVLADVFLKGVNVTVSAPAFARGFALGLGLAEADPISDPLGPDYSIGDDPARRLSR